MGLSNFSLFHPFSIITQLINNSNFINKYNLKNKCYRTATRFYTNPTIKKYSKNKIFSPKSFSLPAKLNSIKIMDSWSSNVTKPIPISSSKKKFYPSPSIKNKSKTSTKTPIIKNIPQAMVYYRYSSAHPNAE